MSQPRLISRLGSTGALVGALLASSFSLADGPVTLVDPGADPQGAIGSSLAITPTWLVAGADAKRFLSPSRVAFSYGAVLLWPRSANGTPDATPTILWPTAGQRGARFGADIDVSADSESGGEWLVVGEPGYRPTSTTAASGRAHVVELAAEGPSSVTTLAPPTAAFGQEFGQAVAIDGDMIVVGAPGYSPTDVVHDVGAVFGFTRSRGAWTLTHTLTAPTDGPSVPPGLYQRFATAVELSDAEVFVGAPAGAELPGLAAGRVDVFNRTSGEHVGTLTAPVETLGDRFGTSLSFAGERVVVGAPGDACGVGQAYVFGRLARGGWELEGTLEAPADAATAALEGWVGFGSSVSLDGLRVAVGTGGVKSEERFGHRVAIFRRVAGTWQLEQVVEGDAGGASASPASLDPAGVFFVEPSVGGGQARYVPLERSPDLNGDGAVNALDLALLLGAWGNVGPTASDLNADGIVNAPDIAELLGAWS
jgi:hypothetical protein